MNALAVMLASAGFLYPVYWISMFLVRAAPSLLHVVFLRHRLVAFECGALWISAACAPPGAFASHRLRPETGVLEVFLVFAVAGVASVALRKSRAIAGFVIAILGQVALTGALVRIFFGRLHTAVLLAYLCLYAGVLLAGLALISSSAAGGYLKRLAAVLIGFCLPLAILSSTYIWLGWFWQIVPVLVIPSVLLAPIAALWNRPPACAVENPRTTTLRRFAACLATTLVLASLIHAGEVMRDRSREAAGRSFLAALPKPAPGAPYPKVFFQRGVNFTAENGYDPQPALPIIDQLKENGVNAIALVPYGFSNANEPAVHYPGGMERSDHIEALTALAHQRGIKVLLKPQLWTHSGFPGNIDWPDARQRARWFAEYRKFLEYYAGLAARIHADLFSVGVELGKMTPYEAEWRALIARARQLYPGPLAGC